MSPSSYAGSETAGRPADVIDTIDNRLDTVITQLDRNVYAVQHAVDRLMGPVPQPMKDNAQVQAPRPMSIFGKMDDLEATIARLTVQLERLQR